MTGIVKCFREILKNNVGLTTCQSVSHKVFYECHKLCFTGPSALKTMLDIMQQFVTWLVHMSNHICYDSMLYHLGVIGW